MAGRSRQGTKAPVTLMASVGIGRIAAAGWVGALAEQARRSFVRRLVEAIRQEGINPAKNLHA